MTRQKRVDRVRTGDRLLISGRVLTVDKTLHVTSETLGDMIEIQFVGGIVMRRSPKTKLERA